MFIIPEDFTRRTIAFYGPDGQTWLDQLPAILADCEQRWQVVIAAPFANLTFHYVAPALRHDARAVALGTTCTRQPSLSYCGRLGQRFRALATVLSR